MAKKAKAAAEAPAMGPTAEAAENVVSISNCGPIEKLRISLPEAGIVVLTGDNGTGKSTALKAVGALMTGKNDGVTLRDGSLVGSIEGFGVKLSISRSGVRRPGGAAVQITGIESEFSIAEFIDPKLKNPEAADSQRIPRLAILSGATPDVEKFAELFGGLDYFYKEIDLTPVEVAEEDITELARISKRELEKLARLKEAEATKLAGKIEGLRESTRGIDITFEDDASKLEAEREAAESNLATLKATARAAEESQSKQRAAELEIESLKLPGRTLEQIQIDMQKGKAEIERLKVGLAEIEQERKEFMANEEKETARLKEFSREFAQAKAFEDKAAELRAILARQASPGIPPDEITEAVHRLEDAKAAISKGALVRRAKVQIEEAGRYAEELAKVKAEAEKLRQNTKRPEAIVSEAIDAEGLKIEDGRIVVSSGGREKYFHDLSAGERTRIALALAVKRIPPGGLLTLPQEFWEGLDAKGRRMTLEAALEFGVLIMTAERSDSLTPETVSAKIFEGGELFAPPVEKGIENLKR